MKAVVAPFVLVWLLLVSSGWALSGSLVTIQRTDDWSVEAAEARRKGLPILILFSRRYCTYCERLKAEVLEPLAKNRKLTNVTCIRELDIDRGGKIRDFDGEKVRTRLFVKRYGIYATPALMLVDDRGNSVGNPIFGFNNFDEYLLHLEKLIETTTHQLAGSESEKLMNPESS